MNETFLIVSKKDRLSLDEKKTSSLIFEKQPTVAAHLRGMWPAPSTDKDILTPNKKHKTPNTTNQTHN